MCPAKHPSHAKDTSQSEYIGPVERSQFIYFIEPVRPDMPDTATEAEKESVSRHFLYLKALFDSGRVILAGRTMDAPFLGIVVFEAETLEAARDVANSDPAVLAGVFRLQGVQPYGVALSRTTA